MSSKVHKRGLMFILSSPSGAGKTTIATRLLEMDKDLINSVSITTRPKRPNEVEGEDYYFISREEYERMIHEGDFLEHAEVFGNGYGTPKALVFESLSRGQDVIFDIDWQGTQKLAEVAPMDVVRVFILPPSYDVLEKRLRQRNTDCEETIQKRMSEATKEMSHWPEYDYVVINEDLEKSIHQVYAILTAERLKRLRLNGLTEFVDSLKPLKTPLI